MFDTNSSRALDAADFTRRTGRLRLASCRGSERVVIQQSHRNGSDEVVGAIEIDTLSDLRAIHFELGMIIKDAEDSFRRNRGNA